MIFYCMAINWFICRLESDYYRNLSVLLKRIILENCDEEEFFKIYFEKSKRFISGESMNCGKVTKKFLKKLFRIRNWPALAKIEFCLRFFFAMEKCVK